MSGRTPKPGRWRARRKLLRRRSRKAVEVNDERRSDMGQGQNQPSGRSPCGEKQEA